MNRDPSYQVFYQRKISHSHHLTHITKIYASTAIIFLVPNTDFLNINQLQSMVGLHWPEGNGMLTELVSSSYKQNLIRLVSANANTSFTDSMEITIGIRKHFTF